MKTLFAVGLCVLSGCVFGGVQPGKYARYPENPYAGIHTIAVLPVGASPSLTYKVDTTEFSNTFATELAKFPGVMVVRPEELAPEVALLQGPMTVDDAVLLAERFDADAVVAMMVTDYDPYMPPKMAVRVEVITARTHVSMRTAFNIDALVRSGRWGELPVRADGAGARNVGAVFELVTDAHFAPTRRKAKQFGVAGSDDDDPFPKLGDSTVYRQDRFMAFVSNEIIRHYFGQSPDFKENEREQPKR